MIEANLRSFRAGASTIFGAEAREAAGTIGAAARTTAIRRLRTTTSASAHEAHGRSLRRLSHMIEGQRTQQNEHERSRREHMRSETRELLHEQLLGFETQHKRK